MFVLVMETSVAPATFTRNTNGNKSKSVAQSRSTGKDADTVVLSLL
jgi:hypothetical protein